jgi:long-subunit acyl-CoA synthetase (AMP-forming)
MRHIGYEFHSVPLKYSDLMLMLFYPLGPFGTNHISFSFSDKLLPKILLLKDQLPHLKTIIVISQEKTNKYFDSLQDHFTIKSFEEIESKGSEAKRNNTEVVLKNPSPDDPAVIMYTSGSTGEPKAQFDINNLYHVIP